MNALRHVSTPGDSNTPFTEIDPDLQFYTESNYIHNMKCDYYLEDTFNDYFSEFKTEDISASFFHLNIKSLPKHYDELNLYLDSLKVKFSFIALTETWLSEGTEELYGIQNYNVVNRFRKGRKGGGVTLYINENIPCVIRNDLEFFDSEMESLFIEVDNNVFQTSSSIIIGIVYRMPDSSIDIFNDRMTDIMNKVNKENKLFYMLGDLNIDLLKYEEHRLTSSFVDILYSNNVFPLITKPTRVTQTTATLIDHVLTNNFDIWGKHRQGILCTDMTDHYAVFHVAGNTMSKSKDYLSPTVKRDMSHRNVQKFIDKIQQVDWQIVTEIREPQNAYTQFHNVISQTYYKCFPYKRYKSGYATKKPWITTAIRESIKTKNKLYINRNKGSNPVLQWQNYRMYRNKLNHLIRKAERKYYQDMLLENKSNLKKSWQILKGIINKRKYRSAVQEFDSNGTIIKDGEQIANKFNKFFVNVGSNLSRAIPKSNKEPRNFIQHTPYECFCVMPVNDEEVIKIISSFKDSSAGWDELKPGIIKNIKGCIAMPLAHICNLSFKRGVFPMQLKIANVVPIYKTGNEHVFSNYRPVSVLPVFSKLLERLMYIRLMNFITNNKLLYKYQFGFQKGKSTYMALILLIDRITEALDKGDCVVGIYLDFSKAFDTVNHEILLQKLSMYGIQDTALEWFRDYLTNRSQYVTYNFKKSAKENITCGVPQGSILGPLLFLIYINDLAMVSDAFLSVLFADDTNLFISGHDIETLCNRINEDLEKIQEWLCANKLSLNVMKTHYMVFTSRNKSVSDIDIRINNVSIERVYVTKFLGILIDSQLNWKHHIEYTCKKLSKCIGILSKAKKKLHKPSLITLYYSFAYPYMIYCNQVWGNNYPTIINKLVLIQKKLVRIITCSPYRAHTEPLMYANKILSPTDINTYLTGTFMYQCIHKDAPELFLNFFSTNSDYHDHDTRHSEDLHVPYGRLDVRKFSIIIHGANVWNSLPNQIKNAQSVHIFKQQFRNYLIEK